MHSISRIPGRSLAVALLAAAALLGAGCQRKASPQGGTMPQAALVAGPTCTPGATAHEKHIGQFSCDTCHPCGGNVSFDEVTTFPRGTSTAGGTLTRSTPTTPASCSVACHFPMGQAAKSVTWNTPGPLECTECHALTSLAAAHPTVPPSPTRADCGVCHSPSTHMTGVLPSTGHGAGWLDTASTNFHALAANRGIASCRGCHGANLDGVGGSATTSCASCHGASWRTSCTMCHGGTADLTGAPPKATWGQSADAVRTGAHTRHVTAGAISAAIACSACHVNPADALSAGHIDGGTAEITWGALVSSSNATPAWNRTTATCSSTYCHGGYSGVYQSWFFDTYYDHPYAGANASPSWTAAGPMTCTSCHANPPDTGNYHSGLHGGGNGCNLCHPHVNAGGDGFTNPALHVNGTIEVSAAWQGSCFSCH
ncbi:MAG: CxxxxCH/CxxCH domain-containing protein [Deltaproteobacteria bacterium]|nr:CxxxxCH/CxxCH domain-containing protein [Deltaproteobacteria bacterium]